MSTLRRALENPRTTAGGLALICSGVGVIVKNPEVLLNMEHALIPLGAIITGISMLYSADAKTVEKGDMPKPQDPPKS